MALTKHNFIISTLTVFALIVFLVITIGNDLVTRNMVDTKSKSYIGNETQYFVAYNFSQYSDAGTSQLKNDEIVTSNSSFKFLSDNFLTTAFYWGSTVVSRIGGILKLIYNLPAFLLLSFSLPIAPFKGYINIFVWLALFTSMVILIVNKARGS